MEPCLIGKQFIVGFDMYTIMVSSWGQTGARGNLFFYKMST